MNTISLLSQLPMNVGFIRRNGPNWIVSTDGKSSLRKLFKEVIADCESFSPQTHQDLKIASLAYDQLKKRFKKESSWLPLSFRQIVYGERKPLEPLYEEAVYALANSVAKTFKGHFIDLLNLYFSIKKDKEYEHHVEICSFLKKVIRVAMENIRNNPPSGGFVYKVTNAKGIDCYLVGSFHLATKTMCQSPLIQAACENSSKFFFEVNTPLVWLSSYLFTWIPEQIFPFNDGIDYAIYSEAKKKGAAIEGLETSSSQLYHGFMMSICDAGQPMLVRENYRGYLENRPWLSYDYDISILEEEWQNGELAYKRFGRHILDIRNQQWEKIMLKQIRETDESICFTFGADHLFGGDFPILEMFNKKFNVSKGKILPETSQIIWEKI